MSKDALSLSQALPSGNDVVCINVNAQDFYLFSRRTQMLLSLFHTFSYLTWKNIIFSQDNFSEMISHLI